MEGFSAVLARSGWRWIIVEGQAAFSRSCRSLPSLTSLPRRADLVLYAHSAPDTARRCSPSRSTLIDFFPSSFSSLSSHIYAQHRPFSAPSSAHLLLTALVRVGALNVVDVALSLNAGCELAAGTGFRTVVGRNILRCCSSRVAEVGHHRAAPVGGNPGEDHRLALTLAPLSSLSLPHHTPDPLSLPCQTPLSYSSAPTSCCQPALTSSLISRPASIPRCVCFLPCPLASLTSLLQFYPSSIPDSFRIQTYVLMVVLGFEVLFFGAAYAIRAHKIKQWFPFRLLHTTRGVYIAPHFVLS